MKLSTTARNAACNAVVDLLDTGYVRIYTGSAPANPQTAASGTLLAELRFNATAFGNATTGAATANAFTADSSANADGTAGDGAWITAQSASDLTGLVGANPSTPIDGVFYKCTATDVWTEYFRPYTYPHPLRNEA